MQDRLVIDLDGTFLSFVNNKCISYTRSNTRTVNTKELIDRVNRIRPSTEGAAGAAEDDPEAITSVVEWIFDDVGGGSDADVEAAQIRRR